MAWLALQPLNTGCANMYACQPCVTPDELCAPPPLYAKRNKGFVPGMPVVHTVQQAACLRC